MLTAVTPGGTGAPSAPANRRAPDGAAYVPDCEDPWESDFSLSDEERSDLYESMMEKGAGEGFDDFFRRMSRRSSSVADQIERLRKKLEAQAKRARSEVDARAEADRRGLDERYGPLIVRLGREEEETGRYASGDELERTLQTELAEALLADHLFDVVFEAEEEEEGEGVSEKKGLWRRFADALKRAWRALVAFLRRLVYGKEDDVRSMRERRAKRLRAMFDLPGLGASGDRLGGKFDALMRASPAAAAKMESELLKKRGRSPSSGRAGSRGSAVQKGGAEPPGARRGAPPDGLPEDPVERAGVLLEEYIANESQKRRRELKRRARREREGHEKAKRKLREARERKAREEGMLERRLGEERRRIDEAVASRPEEMVRKKLVEEMEETGVVRWERGEMVITTSLIERFAQMVLSRELRSLPAKHRQRFGLAVTNRGVYEKGRMLDHHEASRMDIVESYLRSRMYHPRQRGIADDDVVTHREQKGAITHVVLMFDKSGSMEENDRIGAAKRAVLALFKAVRNQDSRNTVDLLAFDTRVRLMDLYRVWHTTPGGFTNTSEALAAAKDVMSRSRADRKIIYLITDGLPEAYTHKGEARAGNPEKSLEKAVEAASGLKGIDGLRLTIILLEPEKEMYVDATRRIAEAAGGRIITTDPKRLAPELLIDYGV